MTMKVRGRVSLDKAWAVFLRDLRRILRNPVAALVVIGIAVVPCLYAWINILANWDPYENTSGIPVAVVNNDQAVQLDSLGEICVGDMMIEALHDNDKIGWQFKDEAQAMEDVRSGAVYATIVIPQDFSKRLTGILDGQTEKAQLRYYVNEKVNPIAPKVTDTGASTLQNTLDSQFVAKVGQVVAEKLGGAVDKLAERAGITAGSGSNVLDEVQLTLVEVGDSLGELQGKLTSAQTALTTAADTLSPLQGVGGRVASKLDSALDRLNDARANANGLVSDLNGALANGMASASSLSSHASADVAAVAGDIALAQAQLDAAIRALESDLTDSEALSSELEAARSLVVSITPHDESAQGLHAEIERSIDREHDVMLQISSAQQAKLDELRALAAKLQTAADEVADLARQINGRVQSAQDTLQSAQAQTLSDIVSQVSESLDSFARSGSQLEAAAKLADPVVSQTITLARQFADALSGADGALTGTRDALAKLADDVAKLDAELSALRASEAWESATALLKSDADSVHDFLLAPVSLNEVALYPVENYASGVAPFFTSLALWVGGIALVAIFKLEVDEDEVGPLRPWQAYFGRWMTFVLVGALQAVACCTGDLLLGIQCAHPWAFYLSALVASFCFVNIIYALSVAFKHLGKALAFTLIILQVPGSAGMYPIEMMPPFFQAIGPWLPFTYSNNAMREAVAGFYGANLAYNLGMLLLFVVPALLLGVTARRHLVNINALFDRRLRETDHLMVIEPVEARGDHWRLDTVVKAVHAPQEYREELEERQAAYETIYPGLVRRGLLALLLLPLLLFGLMVGSRDKLPATACFVVSIVLIYSFLIVVEFIRDRLQRKRALAALPADELEEVLLDTLRQETMPVAPVDALLERRAAREGSGVLTSLLHHKGRSASSSSTGESAADGGAEAGASESAGSDAHVDADAHADASAASTSTAGEPAVSPEAQDSASDEPASKGGDAR